MAFKIKLLMPFKMINVYWFWNQNTKKITAIKMLCSDKVMANKMNGH